jgi:hypothetical protein
MAAIDFPNSPSVNDVFDVAGKKWLYDGTSWSLISVSVTAGATTAYVDTANALKANIASPTFTGTPTLPTGTIATTQTALDSTTKVATTAFVTTADALKANIASPTFTGTVTLPANTITSTMIIDGTIVNADINVSAAIDTTKVTNWENDQVVLNNRIFN